MGSGRFGRGRFISSMLPIDLSNKRAFVAGVADDGGFGFAIAHALAEAGASVVVGTWPPALTIFNNRLERGKMDESRKLSSGKLMDFERVYACIIAIGIAAFLFRRLLTLLEDRLFPWRKTTRAGSARGAAVGARVVVAAGAHGK